MCSTNRFNRSDKEINSLSRQIILNHLDSFYNHDIDSLLSDYTDESIVITLQNTFKGLKEIRTFITQFVVFFPRGETTLILDKLTVEDEVGYIVWHAKTPKIQVSLGSGTFIIKKGKILHQTIIGQLEPVT